MSLSDIIMDVSNYNEGRSVSLSRRTRRAVAPSQRAGEGRGEGKSLACTVCFCLALLSFPFIGSSAEDTNSAVASTTATNAAPIAALDTNSPALPARTSASSKPAAAEANSPGMSNAEPKAPSSKSPPSAPRFELQEFSVIWERNIFNPNRRGRSRGFVSEEPERRSRTETFSLVGTMSYEKGNFAFFEGSSPEYQKVIQSTGSIANYKVTAIAPKFVKLEGTNGQALELAVGSLMKKVEEGDWTMSIVHSTANVSTEDAEAALKRLLQKREQESGGEASAPAETPGPAEEKTEKPAEKTEKSDAGTDDVLKKLLQKREQELNK